MAIRYALLSTVIASLCFSSIGCGPSPTERMRDVVAQAAVVIAALDAYRDAEGGFPESLDSLVPKYLPLLALPPHGAKGWGYRARRGQSGDYILSVEFSDEILLYSSHTGEWLRKDASF